MLRRLAPALGLFLLAPMVAEFLLGNLPITMLPALVALAPMYGGGALLIRELARRAGLGWAGILTLALAYGLVEEGLTTVSLFNPNYAGIRLLDYGHLSALGMGAPWTLLVLTLHTVWSIGVPIALVEAMTPGRRRTPWLGRTGLIVTAVLFLLGIVITTLINQNLWPYTPSVGQLAGVLVAVAALVVVAFRYGRARTVAATGTAPGLWLVGTVALALGCAFLWLPDTLPAWLHVLGQLGLFATAIAGGWFCATRTGWAEPHRLALAGGAALAYAVHAFPERPTADVPLAVDLTGNAVFALALVLLLIVAARRVRR
ncbi:hypothetical protein R8Z50_11180 [Longispora sp. K20-0274]|uniref:hypothetical protein n=1 Tax=Longispora sp. K20-0274 TaxID=3088255 RepID=UPI00399BD20D